MSYRSWDDYEALQQYLDLAMLEGIDSE